MLFFFYLIGVEKIVGWALSHHFMHCTEAASVKDAKLVISTERLFYFSLYSILINN